LSKRNKPPAHIIDKFIEKWFIDEGEIRDIKYKKAILEPEFLKYFDIKYDPLWLDFTRRVYEHQKQTVKAFKKGYIVNPRNLKSEFEEDRRYWRDIAVPILVQNGIYYIRNINREWTGMATLEQVSLIGSKKAKYHLEKADDEIEFLVDVGGRTKKNQQAKFIYKKVRNLQSLTSEIDLGDLEEEIFEIIKPEKKSKKSKKKN